MQDGYTDGHAGEWMTPPDLLKDQLSQYWHNDYNIHVHSNGDLGIQQVLDFNSAIKSESHDPITVLHCITWGILLMRRHSRSLIWAWTHQ
jgi:predicted amidohydrolase YtcJ